MIVVDTSALLAILLEEPEADVCSDALANATARSISAGTVAEALIVADCRDHGQEMRRLMDGLHFEVVPVTPLRARYVADAYARWGRGIHPARLNVGDCFAYALATELAAPLLFVGNDFAATDIRPALT